MHVVEGAPASTRCVPCRVPASCAGSAGCASCNVGAPQRWIAATGACIQRYWRIPPNVQRMMLRKWHVSWQRGRCVANQRTDAQLLAASGHVAQANRITSPPMFRRIKNQRQAGEKCEKMACMPSHHNLAFLAPIQHREPAGSSSPCWCAWAVLREDWLFQRARGEYDGVFGPLRGWWSGGNCDSGPSRLPQSCARQNPPADAAPHGHDSRPCGHGVGQRTHAES